MPRLGHKASFPRINSTLEVWKWSRVASKDPDQCAYRTSVPTRVSSGLHSPLPAGSLVELSLPHAGHQAAHTEITLRRYI